MSPTDVPASGSLRPLTRLAPGVAAITVALLLAACSSTPTRDGPEARPPTGLDKVPDATPRIEPVRDGGPNKPYAVLGQGYTPVKGDVEMSEKGIASWYGKKFHGRKTASGEVYNMYAMTAAHKTMPLPSYARVRNPANGREIVVRVNDRGPFVAGRIIDLSYTAALKLGALQGVVPVEVERITFEQIRNGSWQRGDKAEPPPEAVAPLAPPVAVQPTPERAYTTAAQGYWVQLGAFRARDGAEQFQRRVSDEAGWLSPLLAIFSEPQIYRLQAGPYPTRAEATDAAARVREALKLVPVVVERR
jgi:rare lipoprotein A